MPRIFCHRTLQKTVSISPELTIFRQDLAIPLVAIGTLLLGHHRNITFGTLRDIYPLGLT
ncbi:hypothetical protein AB0P37_49310 [Streptomyces antimycoticus]|uniref:hypothetical protein n=1 Tax=Streptomyces antimycoticus TaxID=68175 RepID=UPI003426D587